MKAGKYTYKELFVNRYVRRIIVPEIQRDYVWKEPQLKGFLQSLTADFKKFVYASVPQVESLEDNDKNAQLQQDFDLFYRKRNYSSNIGFIYAYTDEQYLGRYFLIDGQQRITSIYLLLLVLAARCGEAEEFNKYYRKGGSPVLDYRVRDATSLFLNRTVYLLLSDPEAEVTDQPWFLDGYKLDASISTMLSNINLIKAWLESSGLDEKRFFNFIQDYTVFWYFDTNISAQGENLYIYLNARGEQVQENENLKANLLSHLNSEEEKDLWGKRWEDWQDFFWRKREVVRGAPNPSADKGFNAFLACIAALKQYLSGNAKYLVRNNADSKVAGGVVSDILGLEDIEKYFLVLEYLDSYQQKFSNLYVYADWVGNCLKDIWDILNQDRTDWFVDYSQPSVFSSQTNNMVLVWGVVHWVASSIESNVPFEVVFRGIRNFYLRYHNNVRAASHIKESVERLLREGFISNEPEKEEYQRERWLARVKDEITKREFESLLWSIEDHPLNLDGSDVGGVNITHLLEFDGGLTQDKLRAIRDAFYHCFPLQSNRNKKLQSLLLHYGAYWQRKSPWYYENYQFDNWKAIIRGSPVGGVPQNKIFQHCLMEIMSSGNDVSGLLEVKRNGYEPDVENNDLRSQLLWYNHYLEESMWSQGNFIAIGNGGDDEWDEIFPSKKAFRNTKGDFKGGSPVKLAKILPEEVEYIPS
ncbi:DUF262 domain-containing protein [Modicisalibacter xianhensis]|uniref:Uncharacterized conserved protein, contains ParB-like and HNH nuclease domains n=1 Tax=Modicisalibacter xianhensis TaxID=442341 RepID=A0A1I2ZLK7_9GAMM|nr:DUF262 domain-containing protein [Halomonas xianhensis]SFH38600.1 Uncharacterized conserved protein, contains ParB-like and HNH nuclease domains [Halomonas xianhensis]